MRKLLGVCAADYEDEHMLDLANQVHNKAAAPPLDKEGEFVSMALWREESLAWVRANGEENVATEAARLDAYRELWSLALRPR